MSGVVWTPENPYDRVLEVLYGVGYARTTARLNSGEGPIMQVGDQVYWFDISVDTDGVRVYKFVGEVTSIDKIGRGLVDAKPNGGGTSRPVGYYAATHAEREALLAKTLQQLKRRLLDSIREAMPETAD